MKKSFVLLVVLLCSCKWSIFNNKTPNSCPDSNGRFLLPRSFPAKEIIIGYDSHPAHLRLLTEILKHANTVKPKPKIILLTAHSDLEHAYGSLVEEQNLPLKDVTILPVPSSEALWTQDYFEWGWDAQKRSSFLIDLPYLRDGEDIPIALSLFLKKELVPTVTLTEDVVQDTNGNYGGNIESIDANVIAIGNNMTPALYESVSSSLDQAIEVVDVQWLEPGHVDEVFLTLPRLKDKNRDPKECDYYLYYASPKLAFDLMKKNNISESEKLWNVEFKYFSEGDREDFSKCIYPQNWEEKNSKCNSFLIANKTYSRIIESDVLKLKTIVKRNSKCDLVSRPLPVLFSPTEANKTYGTADDLAMSINPSPVNVISIGKNLIVPGQPYKVFENFIRSEFEKLGLNVSIISSHHLHSLRGGIHCATNIIRSCN